MGKASDTVATTGLGRDPDETAVLDYLLRNPDFLMEHPDVLLLSTPPQRFDSSGGKVVDIQHVMLKRLQTEMADLQDCAEQLIITTRSNMATQKGTLQAALAALESEGLEALARTVALDLPALLDVDVCVLCLERAAGGDPLGEAADLAPVDPTVGDGPVLAPLPLGFIDETFGPDAHAVLRPAVEAEALFYGEAAGLVCSDALVRLDPGPGYLPGLLALGSRLEGTFEPDMAMDLLMFLARVVELCVRRWTPPAP